MADKELSRDNYRDVEKIFWDLDSDAEVEGGGVMNLLKEIRELTEVYTINYQIDLVKEIATFVRFGNTFSIPISNEKLEDEEYIREIMNKIIFIFLG